MSDSLLSLPAGDAPLPSGLAEVLLNLSLAGTMLLRPLYGPDGAEVVDFACVRLNPAAQQLLQLPECPAESFLTLYPTAVQHGVFGFYRGAFLSGQLERRQNLYQHDGLDGYYSLAAQRCGDALVVSFTDANDQPRTAVEEALRDSQAREQAARLSMERERNRWQALVNQAPVGIGLFEGEELRVTAANQQLCTMWGRAAAEVLDRPLLAAVPELQNQGFDALMQQVRETRVPYVGTEVAAQMLRDGELVTSYYNFVYQPLFDAQGAVIGVVDVAVEVTEQVLARQRLEQFNQQLESVVLERTEALRQVHAATEQEREQLYQVFEQTPVAIAILRGANLRIELANPAVGAIWGREPAQVLGRPYFEALPDTAGQGFEKILADVLTTGQPFTITEAPVTLDRAHSGQPVQAYVNFTFQPLRDAAGQTVGLVASGTEVTEQVLARQQVQQLNQELAASNEVLEARVRERTQDARLARAAAERQQQELTRVFEQAPVAIAVYRGPNYIIELANPVVCRLWGRTAEQIIGKGLFEALPEVAGMGFEELLDQVMATGEPYVAHAMPAVHDRDGRRDTVYWDFVYVPMYEADGRIYGAMVVATEVTEQVLARQRVQQINDELETHVAQRTAETQAALREAQDQREQLAGQQRLLRQILSQVPAAVATLTGPEHRFTFFNDRYERLSAGRAALGLTVAEVFPEIAGQGFIDLLDQVYATGQPFIGHDMPAQLLDRTTGQPEEIFVDFVYQPLSDAQGRPQGILAFILDTTAAVRVRRQAQTMQAAMLSVAQRQAQQRQELYQIFEQTPVAIVLLREPDHRIDYFNPAFAELFPPEEWTGALRGHTIGEVYPRVKMAGLVKLLDHVFDTGEPRAVLDMPLAELQPGSPRYVTFAYQAYREEGRIVGVAAFIYDVTDQVLARQQVQTLNEELAAINQEMQATNRELHEANARLVRTNADLDTFVYSASHDLKSPITNIEGLLLALRQQLPPAALQADLVPRLLDMMEGAVSRFQQTLGHLTDVTRLQHVQLDQPAEAVDLPALVESVRLDILPELTAAGATLTVDLAGCPALYFSVKNLRSILYNLFSNAVKYRAPDRPPLVQLRCRRHPSGQAELEVQDNGLGLTPAQQGELFRLFRRLHHHVSGSGVGLYMVKKMVENGGGTLTVQSVVDVGTTFTILLPMPDPAQA